MKRVSRWLMSLCIAALLAGTVGILPAKAADAALKVTTHRGIKYRRINIRKRRILY